MGGKGRGLDLGEIVFLFSRRRATHTTANVNFFVGISAKLELAARGQHDIICSTPHLSANAQIFKMNLHTQYEYAVTSRLGNLDVLQIGHLRTCIHNQQAIA